MKSKLFLILLFLMPVTLVADNKLQFQSPTFERPFYKINFKFEIKKDTTTIEQLLLNKDKFENFIVLKTGKKQNLSNSLNKGSYDFILDYAWKSNKKYKITLLYKTRGNNKTKKHEIKDVSPKNGGIPLGFEGFSRVLTVAEEVGLKREGEIVTATITAPKNEFLPERLLFLNGNSPIEYQILDRRLSFPSEKIFNTHPITTTIKVAFPINMNPFEKKLILVLNRDKEISKEKGFEISGEKLGKTVKNDQISLEFHPKSGQINTIEYLNEDIKLWNEIGVIHWNPGCYIPGVAWDHSYNWNPPGQFEEKSGQFLYLNSRKGPLPQIRDINLEVKYTLESNAPYFVVETQMQVNNDLGVVALRNDEMVLYKELFDSFIYKDKNGKVVKKPLKEIPGAPYGLAHIVADDLDWVGLLNSKKEFGFFCLRLEYININLNASGDFLHKAGTYFYASPDGKYVYWVRPLVYTWAEFATNNHLTFVPRGSTFYDKNAYIVLPLKLGFTEKLDTLLKKLKNPLRVY